MPIITVSHDHDSNARFFLMKHPYPCTTTSVADGMCYNFEPVGNIGKFCIEASHFYLYPEFDNDVLKTFKFIVETPKPRTKAINIWLHNQKLWNDYLVVISYAELLTESLPDVRVYLETPKNIVLEKKSELVIHSFKI